MGGKKENIDNRGSASVFMIMVFTVVILTALFIIDGIRLIMAKQVSAQAGHMALSSVLAGYNEALEKGYGLFALDSSLNQDSDLKRYFDYNLDQTKDAKAGRSSLNYMSGDADAVLFNRSALSNDDVFNSQLYNFMKYYGNSFYEDKGLYCYYFDKIKKMTEALSAKFEYDIKLAEVQEHIQNAVTGRVMSDGSTEYDPASEIDKALSAYEEAELLLDGYSQLVKDADIPDSMKAYLGECVDKESDILDTERIKAAREKIKAGQDFSSDDDVAYLLSFVLLEDTEYYRKTSEASENRIQRILKGYTAVRFIGNGSYEENATDSFTFSRIAEVSMSRADILRSVLSRIKATAARFDNYSLSAMILDGSLNAQIMTAQYVLGFFPAFSGGGSWLGGNDGLKGPLYYECGLSDFEYVLYGHEKQGDDLTRFWTEIRDFIFIWEVFDAFGQDTYVIESSRNEAALMTDGNPLLMPLYTDDIQISYEIEGTYARMKEVLDDKEVIIYRGDCYVGMRLEDFERLFILYKCADDNGKVLERVKSVIVKNMRYSGYKDFSLDSAITMVGIEAEVNVRTTLFGTVKYKYTNYLGY